MGVTGVVLAAGAGRRLGQPKATVMLHGQTLLQRAVRTLAEGGCDDVVAIVRAPEVIAEGAASVVNPDPDSGMGSSLRCALADQTADAIVILLVDLPAVTPAEVADVIRAHAEGADLVAVRREGRRSHPVLVGSRWYADLGAAAVGDQGGRAFFTAHETETRFIDLARAISDIDTPAQLAEAVRSLPG